MDDTPAAGSAGQGKFSRYSQEHGFILEWENSEKGVGTEMSKKLSKFESFISSSVSSLHYSCLFTNRVALFFVVALIAQFHPRVFGNTSVGTP